MVQRKEQPMKHWIFGAALMAAFVSIAAVDAVQAGFIVSE
jgi:hypothetical protein